MTQVSTTVTGYVGDQLLSSAPQAKVTVEGSPINVPMSTGPAHACPACAPAPCPTAASDGPQQFKVKIQGKSILLVGDAATCGVHSITGGTPKVTIS